MYILMSELTAAGINFTKDGVEVRDWPLKPYIPTGIKQDMPRPEIERADRHAKDNQKIDNRTAKAGTDQRLTCSQHHSRR
jgi:hypothetical protein